MNAIKVAALFVAFLVGCVSSNPIDRLVANPPKEAGTPNVCSHLPADATLEQVTAEMLGRDSRYKILETRRVSFGGRVSPYAVLVKVEGRGQRIMVVYYAGEDRGGWWCYTYDPKYIDAAK